MNGDLRLGAFVIPVKDLERAVGFYTEVLGLREVLRLKEYAISLLQSQQGQIWLMDYGGRLEPGGRPTQLVLLTDSGVDEWLERVTGAGCEISQDIHDDPLGRLFIFADSEGNLVEIRQPAGQLRG
jgi:predicted enzyme related to lactoylglutathione lyase